MSNPIQLKVAEQIRDDILDDIQTNTGITDRELGADTRNIAYAVGSVCDEVYYQIWRAERNSYIKTATGASLDARGEDYGLERRGAVAAVGTQVFTGTNGTVIPAETIVSAPATAARDEIQFKTPSTGTYTIAAGTVSVPITAVIEGAEGNLSSATITQLNTTISGVSGTTNTSATVGGQDREEDDDYRERIIAYIDGLSKGTLAALRSGALNFEIQQLTLAEDVDATQTSIPVQEDLNQIPLSITGTNFLSLLSGGSISEVVSYTGIDTSSFPNLITGVTRAQKTTSATTHTEGATVEEYLPAGVGRTVKGVAFLEVPGSVTAYLDDGTTTGISSDLVTLVNLRLVGDGTERDPGYKPAGIFFSSSAATVNAIDVTAVIGVKSGYSVTAVASGAETDLEDFLNSYRVGEQVYGYEIVERIMAYEGVQTITSLVIDGVTFDGTSSADVAISFNQTARAGSVSVS